MQNLRRLAVLAWSLLAGCDASIRSAGGGKGAEGTEAPLLVVGIDPAPGLVEVGPLTEIQVTFSSPVDAASLGQSPLVVTDLTSSKRIDGSSGFASGGGGKTLYFRATEGLQAGSSYRVDLSSGLRSDGGSTLGVG